MIKPEHLKDIDFRSREERQKHLIPDLKEWYEDLQGHQSLHFSPTVQAQITMLSSILWYLLPEKDYKKLTQLK